MKKSLFLVLLMFLGFSYFAQSQEACGQISLIGEFNAWADDHMMTRDAMNPSEFTTILSLVAANDDNGDAIVELKFRANMDWTLIWGSDEFPTGPGVLEPMHSLHQVWFRRLDHQVVACPP